MLNFAYLTKKINFAGLQPDADLVPKYLLALAENGDRGNFGGLQPKLAIWSISPGFSPA
ncbi:MAG: hypothetical protein RBS23_11770 [Mariniphaga sp.]|jgi:hypothetical protein|nr:hypothetical protein [Mariniphaga sp.]